MPRMPAKANQLSEEEVLRRWAALSPEMRETALTFLDEGLVGRVGATFSALVENSRRMRYMGISLAFSPAARTRLNEPSLLISCFHVSQKAMDGDMDLRAKAGEEQPSFFIDRKFVEDAEDLVQRLRIALPDFLSAQSGRRVTPAARWKELFAKEPANVSEYQQLLARLMEQAFWVLPVVSSSTDAKQGAGNKQPEKLGLEPCIIEAESEKPSGATGSKCGRKRKQRRHSQLKGKDVSPTSSKGMVEASDVASTRADSTQTPSETLGSDVEEERAQETAAAMNEKSSVVLGSESSPSGPTPSLPNADMCTKRLMAMARWVPARGEWNPEPNVEYVVVAVVQQKNTFLDLVEGEALRNLCVRPPRRASSLPPMAL